jgi:hypothetical protein
MRPTNYLYTGPSQWSSGIIGVEALDVKTTVSVSGIRSGKMQT